MPPRLQEQVWKARKVADRRCPHVLRAAQPVLPRLHPALTSALRPTSKPSRSKGESRWGDVAPGMRSPKGWPSCFEFLRKRTK